MKCMGAFRTNMNRYFKIIAALFLSTWLAMPAYSALVLKNGATSNVIRLVLKNSTDGTPLTGLTNASSGLIISTIANNEATPTVYTVAGSTIEAVTTLGTFAAPTATKCRFKKIDDTNHPGLYELQIADARFAVSSAKTMVISLSGATNLQATDYEVQLVAFDPQDAVHFGLSAIPNAAAGASTGLLISGSNAGTTTFGALTVTGATTHTGAVTMANGLAITQATLNQNAFTCTGNGNGYGFECVGGSTGAAPGFVAYGPSNGAMGLLAVGTADGAGIESRGGSIGSGMILTAGASGGRGLSIDAANDDAVFISGGGTAKHGVNVQTNGTGVADGVHVTGGASGVGVRLGSETVTGATTYTGNTNYTGYVSMNNGLSITAASANTAGLQIFGNGSGNGVDIGPGATGIALNVGSTGSGKPGALFTGGAAGIADGIKFVANGTGAPIRGDITGNLTGNVTGSVASVSGAVGSVTGNVGGITGITFPTGFSGLTVAAIQSGLATSAAQSTGNTILANIFTAFELNAGLYRLTTAAGANISGGGGGSTAAQISDYMDANSQIASDTAAIAAAVSGAETFEEAMDAQGLTTIRTAKLDHLDIDSSDITGGSGGAARQVNQVPVPITRTWKLKATSAGLVGESKLGASVASGRQLYALDFAADLATNGRVAEINSAVIKTGAAGGVTFGSDVTDTDDYGVDKSQAKLRITPVIAGTYVLRVSVDYDSADGGGTTTGDVTLVVTP